MFVPKSVVVADGVQDEGESTPKANVNSIQEASTNDSPAPAPAPSTPTKQPLTQDTPPVPSPTRMHPPPGYYTALHEGETVAFAAALHQLEDGDDEGLTRWQQHALAAAVGEPSLAQALSGPDAEEWQEAINYEIGQLEKLRTWEVLTPPSRANIIPCHYVLATKCGTDGQKLKL